MATLSLILLVYIVLSSLFWFDAIPTPPQNAIVIASSVAGPPAMLLWGRDALLPFALATLLLFFLLYRALGLRQHYRLWFAAAVAVWLVSGFLSYAVSI